MRRVPASTTGTSVHCVAGEVTDLPLCGATVVLARQTIQVTVKVAAALQGDRRCHHSAMVEILVVLGDITAQDVDAIVTAANESLLGGGGVDGAIHRAAGSRLADAGAVIAPCLEGDAMATPAFNLNPPVRHIIHTVGPVWEGGGYGEADILASCYRRVLAVADQLAVHSIALPAIATGVYGFPAAQAAQIAVETIRSTHTEVDLIRLVAFDEEAYAILAAAVTAS